METTSELRDAVYEWQQAAAAAIATARRGARMSALQLASDPVEYEPPVEPEGTVEALLGASERILGQLPGELQNDPDAAARALALVAGSFSVVDALAGATDPPETILAEHRLLTLSQFGRQADSDVDLYAGVMLGSPNGGADAPATTLPLELTRLGDVSGHETVALATNVIFNTSLDPLLKGFEGIVDAAKLSGAFGAVAQHLRGLVNRFKRAATSIVQWIAERAERLLPSGLASHLRDKIAGGALSLVDPSHVVGALMVNMFGASGLRTQWDAIPEPDRPRIDTRAIDPFVAHIGWITTSRRAIDRWGAKVVLDLARTVPNIQLAYYIVVAVAIVFVGSQAAFGVRALGAGLRGP